MKLLEHEGKEIFRTRNIATPKFELLDKDAKNISIDYPVILKSQVPTGDRMAKGGIVIVEKAADLSAAVVELFALQIDGNFPEYVLAEELILNAQELYVSFSYSSEHRSPVLALNKKGGTGIHAAHIVSVSILEDCSENFLRTALHDAEISESRELLSIISRIWKLFIEEKLLLVEVNPLFLLSDGSLVAGDAKVIRDDALLENVSKPFVSLDGDIAIIASGGGASMLNIDILMRVGGKPANYVEYSGNPPASVVEELTKRVLSQPGIRGLWVIGGTANFTDIYETMMGFVAGLRLVSPMPTYPIVIRRDGPRQKEAKEMLLKVAASEGYDMHIYGPELSMSESAVELLKLMQLS